MALFNFIETFFFISLAITFLLILLLVYHFKQRLENTEQKCDSMFEIVNNIVKELNILRNAQLNMSPPQFSTNHQNASHTYNRNVHVVSPNIPFNVQHTSTMKSTDHTDDTNNIYVSIVENQNVDNNIIISELKSVEDEEDDTDDDDEYDDSDEDEDAYDDDVMYTGEEFDDDEIVVDITETLYKKEWNTINNDTSTEAPIEIQTDISTENIKIINMDIDEIVNISSSSVTDIEPVITPSEQFHVEKLDNTEVDNADQEDHENDRDQDNEINNVNSNNSTVEQSKEVYRKMNLHTLKTLVITKGLSSDPSKLKKPELIKLLETIAE